MVDVFDPNKIENTEFASRSGISGRDAFSVPRARVSARQLPGELIQAVGSGVLSRFGVDRPLRVEKRQAQLTQGTIQDARQIKRAIENENTNEAISILVDRMNILDRMGEDSSDTRMLRDALVAGRPDVVMREVNTFLNNLPVEYIDPDMVTEQGQMISRRAGGAPTAEAVGGFEVKPEEQYRPLTQDEIALYRLDPKGSYRMNARTGKVERIGSGGTTINMPQVGSIPPGYRAVYNDQGQVESYELIPGSPEAQQQAESESQAQQRTGQRATYVDVVLDEISSVRNMVENQGPLTPVTGFMGARMRSVEGSPAFDMAQRISTIKGNTAFTRLEQMREASKTGGALGSITEGELELLSNTLGALNPDMSDAEFLRTLTRLEETYTNIMNKLMQEPEIARQYGIEVPSLQNDPLDLFTQRRR